MASKRPPPAEDEPPSASGEDEEEGSDDDSDEEPPPMKPSSHKRMEPQSKSKSKSEPKPKPKSEAKPSSSSKPIANETKNPKSKEPTPPPPPPPPANNNKPEPEPEMKPLKDLIKAKKKKVVEPEPEPEHEPEAETETEAGQEPKPEAEQGPKKLLFQRLWSEEDEIAVLRGVIEFKEQKGVDPAKEMGSFFDFIKGSLHFDVSLAQLKDKVWRLKRKFEKSVRRGSKGEDKTFAKEHDQLGFDLSKRIWGSERIDLGGKNSNESGTRVRKSNVVENYKKRSGSSSNNVNSNSDSANDRMNKMAKIEESVGGVGGGMEEFVRKKGLDLIEGEKREEMEERWRELHVSELQLFLKRNELVKEQAKLMLAVYETEED